MAYQYRYITKKGLLKTFIWNGPYQSMPADYARMATASEVKMAENALKNKKGLGDFWSDLTKEFQTQVVQKTAETAAQKVAATAGAQAALPVTQPVTPTAPSAPAQSALVKYLPLALGGAALIFFLPKLLKRSA